MTSTSAYWRVVCREVDMVDYAAEQYNIYVIWLAVRQYFVFLFLRLLQAMLLYADAGIGPEMITAQFR